MSESFVDLTYRGLPLGRRVKLTQVRPSTGYLEVPQPMPVGTQIAIATDDGVAFDAVVAQVHEQVGGAERAPGMLVTPALGGDAAAAWWRARVALPELEAPPDPRGRGVTLHPRTRSATIPTPPPPAADDAGPTAPPPAADDAGPTAPMSVLREDAEPAVDLRPTLEMSPLAGGDVDAAGEIDAAGAAEPPLVDDGKRTIMMHSIDLSALGLEAGAAYRAGSGGEGRGGDDGDSGGGDGGDGGDGAPGGGPGRRGGR